MTQEFVTLPREVVEQAIEALFCTDSEEGSIAYKNELEAVKKLRAALDKPQANQPAMTPIAQRKLDDLVASGYTISGYSVYHEQKHQHGFVTGAGLVGWWRPEGMEHPQPLGEQEPIFWYRPMIDGLYEGPLHKSQIERVRKESGGWVQLYTHPQPKREPLTDEQVDAIADAMPGGLEGFMNGWGWRQFARAVIEATHNIK